jgi:transcription initiation factor TFIID TATA-box-binding protein
MTQTIATRRRYAHVVELYKEKNTVHLHHLHFNFTTVNMSYQIVNLVATGDFNENLDLNELSESLPHSENRKGQFRHLVIKDKKLKFTGLLYTTGKCVITGTRSKEDAQLAYTIVHKKLFHAGVFCDMSPIQIRNITVSGKIANNVSLTNFTSTRDFHYEPELFPAIVYSNGVDKFKSLIFKNGKFISTGFKHTNQIEPFYKSMLDKITPLILN